MIDKLIDVLESGINYEMGRNSPYYNDRDYVQTTNKELTFTSPNRTIAVLEGDSVPIDYSISHRISQTTQQYMIQMQIFVKGTSEEKAKALRRKLTSRLKHALLRYKGPIFSGLMTCTDSGVGYFERTQDYKIERIQYEHGLIKGKWIYMSAIDLLVKTDVNYYNS